ncbi:MAG: hypothetical protein AAB225_03760, partial [Acidobacteriota bacterium]
MLSGGCGGGGTQGGGPFPCPSNEADAILPLSSRTLLEELSVACELLFSVIRPPSGVVMIAVDVAVEIVSPGKTGHEGTPAGTVTPRNWSDSLPVTVATRDCAAQAKTIASTRTNTQHTRTNKASLLVLLILSPINAQINSKPLYDNVGQA